MAVTQLQQAEAKAEEDERLSERIPDFYRGRCVLLTGGSGFVGRVLLEKLLRCCPDLHTVFLLLRTRKGVLPHDRLKALTDVPLFDRLHAERPGALDKVQVIASDLNQPGLGLSAADAQLLREHVSIVFHLGANVRFNNSIQDAVQCNTRGTISLLDLATQMPLLKTFVHVSTTYCNEGQNVLEEKLYPTSGDWRSILNAVETLDPIHLGRLTPKILGQHYNTYTFSKDLAERVVNEYADRLPVGIVRPSIVVSTWDDPFPGWIDNYNGPVGLTVAGGKGIVHCVYSAPDSQIDYIPCDVVVKGLIISSFEIARRGIGDLSVYHASQFEMGRFKQEEIINTGLEILKEAPYLESLYYPTIKMTGNGTLFFTIFLFFQLLPAAILDGLLFAKGRKPMFVRLQRQIYLASVTMAPFLVRSWDFVNKRFLELDGKLVTSDCEAFALNLHKFNPPGLFEKELLGARRYLLQEPDKNLPEARRRQKRNRVIHLALKTLFFFAVIWIGQYALRFILWKLL